ncbi:MAG: gamma-glutamylcyclotransferase [Deltaproteobacteria bacterium]|nr:gamma-glutamylcyclotransferase [Deltaproteobacteria bacterium]
MNIFTYGTLMLPRVMYAVTARKLRFVDAMLRGYARFTVKGESYPGIIPVTEAVTEGIIYFHDFLLKELIFKGRGVFIC